MKISRGVYKEDIYLRYSKCAGKYPTIYYYTQNKIKNYFRGSVSQKYFKLVLDKNRNALPRSFYGFIVVPAD